MQTENNDKNAYQQKMEAQLEKMKADIQRLEAELKERKADTHIGAGEHMQALRQRRDRMQEKLHTLKSASGEAWQEARDGVAAAWRDLSAAFQSASTRFKQR